jgi:hypothetical protein
MNHFIFWLAAVTMLTGHPAGHVPATITHQASVECQGKENGLFESDDVFNMTIRGEMRPFLNDAGKVAKKFPMQLLVQGKESDTVAMDVMVRQRGHFRRTRQICELPPVLIEFPKTGPQLSTIFKDQKKLKLVMPCVGDDYVIREWLVYKLYNLITPKSFRARLVKVSLEDSRNKKLTGPRFGILLEEEKQMAARNKMISLSRSLRPQQTRREDFITMAVFEYLIGNTDWSVQYLQNIKLIAEDSTAMPVTVPYDFDHAGIVNAPYAKPAEELLMSSVRQRRYRGLCEADLETFDEVIKRFNDLKKDIYQLYGSCTLLSEKYLKSTIQYLDEFYRTINTPKLWRRDFAYPCDKNGTGNVVIKGLRED